MKRLILTLLAMTAFAAPAAAKVYKLGLIMADRHPSRDSEEILNAATTAFFESKRFDVIERSRLDKVFEERDLQDFIEGAAGDLSNLEGVDMLGLVTYSIENGTSLGGIAQRLYYIDVRMTDVTSGQIVGTVSSRRATLTYDPTTPYNASRCLLQNVREMFPPEGIVIRISGNEVIVDIGEESGIRENDVLEVIREGETIFHPTTGKPLPPVENVVATLKVTEPANQMSKCKMQKSDLTINVTDRVRLKEKDQKAKKIFRKVWPFRNKG